MKISLKLEEMAMFLLGFFLFMRLELPVWYFFALILVPDVGMLGYLFGNKIGAISYNIFHHKGLAVLIYFIGSSFLYFPSLQLAGIILFSHASIDRVFGYGLKYKSGFTDTHMGKIGNRHG